MNNAIVTLSDLGRGRGEGTPLSHIGYVPPQRVGLFSPFDLITGVGRGGLYFAHFGLESDLIPRSTPPPGTGNWTVYDIAEPFFRDTVFK